MPKKLLLLCLILFNLSVHAEPPALLRISILTTNKVLLDGKPVKPAQLINALSWAQERNGEIWYFRENAAEKAPPVAEKVIRLLLESRLPISLSTKPDFSDYIGKDGTIHPR